LLRRCNSSSNNHTVLAAMQPSVSMEQDPAVDVEQPSSSMMSHATAGVPMEQGSAGAPHAQQHARQQPARKRPMALCVLALLLVVAAICKRPWQRPHRSLRIFPGSGSPNLRRDSLESVQETKPAMIEPPEMQSGVGTWHVPLHWGATRKPTHYHLHLGAGSTFAGELHATFEGTVNDLNPKSWLLMYQRRWTSTLRAWRPLATLRLMPKGCEMALRWSHSLSGESPEELCDGSGLEVHLESLVAAEWPSARELTGSLELPTGKIGHGSEKTLPRFKQSAELIIGPLAQARYLNVSLPVGVLLGASLDSRGPGNSGEQSDWTTESKPTPRVYASFTVPGLNDLRGWLCQVEADDSWAGQVQAHLLRPWARGSKALWSIQHQRRHGAVSLPHLALGRLRTAVAGIASSWDGRVRGSSEGLCEAVIPTTLVKLGSAGRLANVRVESQQAGLGGPGFIATMEAGTNGWGIQLGLAGGNSQRSWGQPQYSITTQAPWGANISMVAHEIKWLFQDGQGFWVTIRDSGSGPRMNAGIEIR